MVIEQQSNEKIIKDPFVGPRPFKEGEEDIFFGRDQETSELASLIIAHPIVLLYAQSGAGKTSLLTASLIPLLKKRKIEVLPTARVRGQEGLSVALPKEANVYIYNALEYLSHNVLSQHARSTTSLADYLPPPQPASRREVLPLTVVIFDQFEELFTTYPERFVDRQRFFEQVSNALDQNSLLRIVFAMREDFIAELDPYISILPEKLQARFRLLRLKEDAAQIAIEKPIKRVNQSQPVQFIFDSEAADTIVDNLRTICVKTPNGDQSVLGPFIEPVHLQVVCRTLWNKLNQSFRLKAGEAEGLKEVIITKDYVEEFGDVNKALSEFYEEGLQRAIQVAAAESQQMHNKKSHSEPKLTEGILRAWFDRTLITPEGTRGTVFGGRKAKTINGIPRAAINELEEQRLIRGELRGGEMWYELSHDRFIQPIRESNERWLHKLPLAQQKGQDLERRATEWNLAGKPRHLLLDQTEQRDAKRWMESPEGVAIGYSDTLFALIQASQAVQQQRRFRLLFAGSAAMLILFLAVSALSVYAFKQRAIAEASRGNAIAAEAEAKRLQIIADEKSKDAQNLAGELQVKAAAAAEAESAALKQKEIAIAAQKSAEEQKEAAIVARGEAEQRRLEAITERDISQAARLEAEKSRREALLALERAREQESIAFSREVAAHSVSIAKTDPELSILLAIEADKIRPTEEAEAALRSSLPSLSNMRAVLRGHTQPVTEAMFTTGSDRVITLSSGGVAKVWDVKSGQILFNREGGVALSHNGRFLMLSTLGGYDVVQVPETGSGRVVSHLAFTGRLTTAVLSPDGKLAAIDDGTDTLLYEVDSARRLAVITARRLAVIIAEQGIPYAINASNSPSVFSPDGKLLVTIRRYRDSVDKILFSQLQVWDTRTAQRVWSSNDDEETFGPIAFSPDGRSIVIGSKDRVRVFSKVEVYGSRAERESASPGFTAEKVLSQDGVITDISFSPHGDRLVTTSTNNTASVWDTTTWQRRTTLSGHTNAVRSAGFSPDGEYIVTASFDNTARVWEATTGRSVQVLSGHSGPVTRATFSMDGRSVVTASEDNSARVWVVNREVSLIELKGHSDGLKTASFSPDGGRAVTASEDGTVRIWEVGTGNEIHTLSQPGVTIYCATFSPDGRSVATASGDGTVRIWDASNGRELRLLRGHKEQVYWVSFSSDGKLLATAGIDKTVRVWDFNTGQEIKALEGPAPIKHVVFSPDGRFIAAAVLNGTALVWELQTGKPMQTLRGQGDRGIFSVAYSPDGRYILTSGFEGYTGLEGSARIWEVNSGQVVSTLVGHKAGLLDATFSHDGKYIVTASRDNTARVWEASTGKALAELRGHTGMVTKAELSADDMYVITASDDGTARIYSRIWFAPLNELLKLASERVSRSLSAEEKARYLHEPSAK
jgi:WD40 repeat protein